MLKNGFLGNYKRKVDDKNRITIPKIFLEGLDGNREVILGKFSLFQKNMIAIFPNRQILEENLHSYIAMDLNFNSSSDIRFLSTFCFNHTIDASGRICLKDYMIVPSDRELVFVGRDELFEIWDKDDYNCYLEKNNYKLFK